jgi:hypothetical protein
MKVIRSFSDGYYDFPYHSRFKLLGTRDLWKLIRTAAQFLVAAPILPAGDGENIVFILEKA